MNDQQAGDVTTLLREVRDGLPGAADRLMALVYQRLKQIARNRTEQTGLDALEPTTLVHETYLRLFERADPSWENRNHFFWAAARAMHDILVERARSRCAAKRGGNQTHVRIDDSDLPCFEEADDLLAISDSVRRLEEQHPESARLVMLRFFAGLTRDQVAEVTGLHPSAVWREWTFAKAWLLSDLQEKTRPDSR